ncbi:MAG: ABC transporter substrate-binding protein [Pigmentiphaga sp.]|nr:ABC transporter substrate-binding protein [Pigmentiphaga sp.]
MKKSMKLILALVLALPQALMGSGTALAAEPVPKVIRFGGFGQGFGKPSGLALLAIAQNKNFIAEEFRGEPVEFTFEYFIGVGPAINEALANNRLDFAQYGALPNIIGRAGGLPTRLLSSYGATTIFGVAAKGSEIRNFSDLRGKRVAVNKGTILHWALLSALRENGLTLGDVHLIDLKAADQLAALTAGSVDAAIGSSSLLTLRDQGTAEIFYRSDSIGPQANGFGAIVVSERFWREYPEATRKVAKGLVKAAHWLGDEANKEEAIRIWAQSGVSEAHLREEFEGVPLRSLFNPRFDPFLIGQYEDAVAFSREERLIRNDVDVENWVLAEPVERAVAELALTEFWPSRPARANTR